MLGYVALSVLIIRVKFDTYFTSPAIHQNVRYDIGSDEPVSMAVVRAVSAVEGRDPLSLPLLTNVLSPDALNALFGPREDGTARTSGQLSFVYSNCRLTIDKGEYLTVQLLENHSS